MHRTPIRSLSAVPMEGALSRRRFWQRCLCGLAPLGLLFVAAAPVRPDFIYWNDGGNILRANVDGTGQVTLINGLDFADSGWALDLTGGQIYGTALIEGAIRRANLDGTGQTTLIQGLVAPGPPVLDLAGGQMYWPDWGHLGGGPEAFRHGSIQRANLDGTGLTTLVGGLSYPGNHIALDLAGGKMYWVNNYDPSTEIRRANLDGSGQEIVVPNAAGGGGRFLDYARCC